MQSKYFTVEVRPTIANVAVGQHAAFANGDVLFDWTAFQIPRGPAKLIGISAEIRPKGDSGSTVNKFPFELLFAKSKATVAPSTLGPLNSAPAASVLLSSQADRFLGIAPVVAGDFVDADQMSYASASPANIVLQGEPNSGDTVGTDTIYVGGIAGDAFNFVSGCLINAGTLDGSEFTVDGVDPRLFMIPGDIINATTASDTSVSVALGTIASMADANTITLTATTEAEPSNNDFIYNTRPIKLILSFEK